MPDKDQMIMRVATDREDSIGARRIVSGPVAVVAWLHIALGAAGIAAGLFACSSFWLIPGRFSNTVLAFIVPIFLFFAIFVFVPALIGGIALWNGKAWGRILVFLFSAMMLLVFPIGTVLGGFSIWALVAGRPALPVSPSRTVPPETAAVAASPITRAYIAITLLVLTASGAAGILVLAILFRFQEQDPPSLIADMVAGATVALPVAAMLALLGIAMIHRRTGN